jgi:hypothetical protein
MTQKYTPVPVEAAKAIAEKYEKDIVIVNSWDTTHGLLHTTTFGVSEEQKHQAAVGGEVAATALGADLNRKDIYEDFRREIVICAAIKTKGGQIIRGDRHSDILALMGQKLIDRKESVQGFITSRNRFVNRHDAADIQKHAKIPSKNPEGYNLDGNLYSEDLY